MNVGTEVCNFVWQWDFWHLSSHILFVCLINSQSLIVLSCQLLLVCWQNMTQSIVVTLLASQVWSPGLVFGCNVCIWTEDYHFSGFQLSMCRAESKHDLVTWHGTAVAHNKKGTSKWPTFAQLKWAHQHNGTMIYILVALQFFFPVLAGSFWSGSKWFPSGPVQEAITHWEYVYSRLVSVIQCIALFLYTIIKQYMVTLAQPNLQTIAPPPHTHRYARIHQHSARGPGLVRPRQPRRKRGWESETWGLRLEYLKQSEIKVHRRRAY